MKRGLQVCNKGVTRGDRGLQGVTGGFLEVTRGSRELKGVTVGYKEFQGVTLGD